jgi:hypothetical protein
MAAAGAPPASGQERYQSNNHDEQSFDELDPN